MNRQDLQRSGILDDLEHMATAIRKRKHALIARSFVFLSTGEVARASDTTETVRIPVIRRPSH
jgi:hypothetical protein